MKQFATRTHKPAARRRSCKLLGLALILLTLALAVPAGAVAADGWLAQESGTAATLNGVAFTDATHGWVVGARPDGTNSSIILATTNGGATWSPQWTGATWLTAVAFSDASHGWAVGGTILATTDGGATWGEQRPESGVDLYAVAFPDASHGWAVGSNGIDGVILATTNGGATWSEQGSVSGVDYFCSVAFSDATHGWAVGNDYDKGVATILATTDGGTNWSEQWSESNVRLSAVAFSDATHGWVVGSNGVILATTDGGTTWGEQRPEGGVGLGSVAFSDATHGWAVGDIGAGWPGVILATTDGGATWSPQSPGDHSWLNCVAFSDATHGWVVGRYGTILATTTGGKASTFSPNPDGWRFPNGGDNITYDDFAVWAGVFGWSGKSRTSYDSQTSAKEPLFSGGICFGMSASTVAYQTGRRNLSASGLDAFAAPWAWGPGQSGYPQLDGSTSIVGPMRQSVREEIETFHVLQFASAIQKAKARHRVSQEESWTWRGEPSFAQALYSWTRELETAVAGEAQILSIGGRWGIGPVSKFLGHAAVAYRVERLGSGSSEEVRIHIYDPKYPGDANRYVSVWPAKGKWKYDLALDFDYGSEKAQDYIAFLPVTSPLAILDEAKSERAAGAQRATVPQRMTDAACVIGTSAAVFSDSQGRRTGWHGASYLGEIPELASWTPAEDASGGSEVYYSLPAGETLDLDLRPGNNGMDSVTLGGAAADTYVTMTWPRSGTTAGTAADCLHTSGDDGHVAITPGDAEAARVVVAAAGDAPPLAADLTFAGGARAGQRIAAAAAHTVDVSLAAVAGGVALTVKDDGALGGRTIAVGWATGVTDQVTVPAGATVQVTVTGGAASGAEGKASNVTVRTDTNDDGTWEHTTQSTLAAPTPDAETTFDPPDTLPPATSDNAGLAWHKASVTVDLAAQDFGGSGVAYTEWSLDGGITWSRGASALVDAEGETILSYRSADKVGNAEVAKTATVRIDRTGPTTTAGNKLNVKRGKLATFRFSVADRTPKSTVTISIYRGAKLTKSLAVGTMPCGSAQSYVWKKCTLAKGKYTWKVHAVDEAGNAQVKAGAKTLIVR